MLNPRKETSSGPITEDSSAPNTSNEARIKVIGFGGGVSNDVNHMIQSEMIGLDFWIVNTDIQTVRMSPVFSNNSLQIDKELTKGLGAGNNLEIGITLLVKAKKLSKKHSMVLICFLSEYVF